MGRSLTELRAARDLAAQELIATNGWRSSREQVVWAVEAMIANSERSTSALAWILHEMRELPDQSDADSRLVDLSLAIANVAEAELLATSASLHPYAPEVRTFGSPAYLTQL